MVTQEQSKRPEGYRYIENLKDHLGGLDKIFNGELIYPRQMEFHLPANGKKCCNFGCFYCQGRLLKKPLGNWEQKGIDLMENLKGVIPYHMFGGAYTEPMLSDYLLDYLKTAKKYSNSFGVHVNGSLLISREDEGKFCSTLVDIATPPFDYITISLDAGTVETHCKTKNIKADHFSSIIEGLRLLVKLRGEKTHPAVRVCYLMNEYNSSDDEIRSIVSLMKEIGVDSLRFSIPYDLYGKDFDIVRQYRNDFELPFGDKCAKIVEPYLSSKQEIPFVFWHPPGYQDVDKMCYKRCIYSYYQITYGADGNVYRCTSVATPSFSPCILGKVTGDLEEFHKLVIANQNPNWDAGTCFKMGARCNRVALEINSAWDRGELG